MNKREATPEDRYNLVSMLRVLVKDWNPGNPKAADSDWHKNRTIVDAADRIDYLEKSVIGLQADLITRNSELFDAKARLSETAPKLCADCGCELECVKHGCAKKYDALAEAMRMVIRQNSNDMLLTGEELRRCELALADYNPAARCVGAAQQWIILSSGKWPKVGEVVATLHETDDEYQVFANYYHGKGEWAHGGVLAWTALPAIPERI